jgi:hypothetical protein
MKAILAAVIAIVALWVVDASFNGGRYTLAGKGVPRLDITNAFQTGFRLVLRRQPATSFRSPVN